MRLVLSLKSTGVPSGMPVAFSGKYSWLDPSSEWGWSASMCLPGDPPTGQRLRWKIRSDVLALPTRRHRAPGHRAHGKWQHCQSECAEVRWH